MPRFFDNSSGRIELSVGACDFTPGNISIAAIVKFAADNAWEDILIGDNGSNVNAGFTFQKSDNLGSAVNALYFDRVGGAAPEDAWSSFTLGTSDGWCLVAVTCASGLSTPVFHKYNFSTRTWTHSNGNQACNNAAASPSKIIIGQSLQFNDKMNGDIAVTGLWNSVLSDAQVETLAVSLLNWPLLVPKGLWFLNQKSTSTEVYDYTSNGANQTSLTGTSISTSEVPFEVPKNINRLRPRIFAPGLAR